VSRNVADVALPEVDEPLPEAEAGTPVEYGWRISYGKRVGQREMEAGVVREFERDRTVAGKLFHDKSRAYMVSIDTRVDRPGYHRRAETRTGRYVAMAWVSRFR
jgi:hypothetical protein